MTHIKFPSVYAALLFKMLKERFFLPTNRRIYASMVDMTEEEKRIFLLDEKSKILANFRKGDIISVIYILAGDSAIDNVNRLDFINNVVAAFAKMPVEYAQYVDFISKYPTEDNTVPDIKNWEEFQDELLRLPFIEKIGIAFCEMWLLDIIRFELKQIGVGEDESQQRTTESYSEKIIEEKFKRMDGSGWEYAFYEYDHFKLFKAELMSFFDNQSYCVPNLSINLKPKVKTKLASTLGDIYLSLAEGLKGDTLFFNLVRILSPFRELTDCQIYDMLKR